MQSLCGFSRNATLASGRPIESLGVVELGADDRSSGRACIRPLLSGRAVAHHAIRPSVLRPLSRACRTLVHEHGCRRDARRPEVSCGAVPTGPVTNPVRLLATNRPRRRVRRSISCRQSETAIDNGSFWSAPRSAFQRRCASSHDCRITVAADRSIERRRSRPPAPDSRSARSASTDESRSSWSTTGICRNPVSALAKRSA